MNVLHNGPSVIDMEEIDFKCVVCTKTISWKPNMVVGETSSFECENCGQFYRVDEINFKTQRMQVVKVDREDAINAMKEEGLL